MKVTLREDLYAFLCYLEHNPVNIYQSEKSFEQILQRKIPHVTLNALFFCVMVLKINKNCYIIRTFPTSYIRKFVLVFRYTRSYKYFSCQKNIAPDCVETRFVLLLQCGPLIQYGFETYIKRITYIYIFSLPV